MKRIFIALAVLLTVQLADAQVKTPEAAKKAVESAKAASLDAKKATKVATWTKLADAYLDAYNAPKGNAWIGASKMELQYVMGPEQPVSIEAVTIGGEACQKEVYSNKDMYFNPAGQLIMINVTSPVVEDALAESLNAFLKAYEVDVKQSKTKDIKEGIGTIKTNYYEDGMNAYMLEDYNKAAKLFAKAADVSFIEPYATPDTTALYNAGFAACQVKDFETAKTYLEKCLEINHFGGEGEVFSKLAEAYKGLGDNKAYVAVLEQGFSKFPQSQGILIGLINYYIESKENPDKLFVLIGEAKKNEPNNASLYYVEGNIYKELGQTDKAVEAYYKCAEINPAYEFGFIGAGIMFYDLAVELQQKASAELDNAKYEALVVEFETALQNALEPFEKAYEISKDNGIKVNIAEYLKNIYYRFVPKGAEYEAGYNKYNEIVKTGQAN